MANVGRPTKYHDQMPERLACAMLQGKSVVRFCRDENIHPDSFYEWVKVHPEFSEAFGKGKKDCEAYWEDWLVENFNAEKVNSALVKLFFANRFDWHDKTESKAEVKVTQELSDVSEARKQYQKDV